METEQTKGCCSWKVIAIIIGCVEILLSILFGFIFGTSNVVFGEYQTAIVIFLICCKLFFYFYVELPISLVTFKLLSLKYLFFHSNVKFFYWRIFFKTILAFFSFKCDSEYHLAAGCGVGKFFFEINLEEN